MAKKVALVTGITGQDGSYLAELLLKEQYDIVGIVRRSSSFNRQRIEHLHTDEHLATNKIRLMYGDMTDSASIEKIVADVKPDEIYNLAAQSHVLISFETPEYTANTNALGTLRILEAIRNTGLINKSRFYQASTSEIFGAVLETPQTETTPLNPQSPYGAAKAYALYISKNYRESYGMFVSNGILFNHESPMRGENFVTRKVTISVANILAGSQDCLFIGNLDAKRDWGFAGDYVKAMWLMLQQDKPEDFVVATGETRSVREFIDIAFGMCGVGLEWKGTGVDERGIEKKTGKVLVKVDPRYFRPAEVNFLLGDYSKAKKLLGWEPTTTFTELVKMMVSTDLKRAGLDPSKIMGS